MAIAIFVQRGEQIHYVPTTDRAAGEVVVQGDFVGVTVRPIAANTLGTLVVSGVFDFPKSTGAAYTAGQVLYWDDANKVATDTATGNKLLGKAVQAAGAGTTTVRVLLSQ